MLSGRCPILLALSDIQLHAGKACQPIAPAAWGTSRATQGSSAVWVSRRRVRATQILASAMSLQFHFRHEETEVQKS